MRDEPTFAAPDEGQDRLQTMVLELMLTDDAPGLWSTRELALAVGDELAAADAIAELRATGLIHVHAGFAFPTRAAVTFRRLEQPVAA
jgi:hypothetical protein